MASNREKKVVPVLIVYLCGALATALAGIGGAIRYSDPRTGPRTQVAVVVMAAVFWPVVAVGALQAFGMLLLANWFKSAPDADASGA
ncbi:MAG: hypothetical protein ACPGVG_03240, partial [Mycobacterium sp.]